MKKYIYILITLFVLTISVKAQKEYKPFAINGTVNINSGVIKLLPIDDEFYHKLSVCDSSVIENGKFKFRGLIDCPTGFRLRLEVNEKVRYISDIFYVTQDSQSLTCDMQTAWNIPEISNFLMTEQKEIFDPLWNAFEKTTSQDSVLLLYATKYPNSYLNLWKLIDHMSVGYKAIYDSIFNLLPEELKSCYAGKIVEKKLQSSRVLALGNKFPDILLLTTSFKTISISSESNGYTLYDFWFTHCMPCISQFPELKKIYAEYHSKAFNIKGILSDNIENVKGWKSIIKKHELKWGHYLDLDRKKSNEFSIKKFPTNYLTDKNGIIVAKDLRPEELRAFLNSHINKIKN